MDLLASTFLPPMNPYLNAHPVSGFWRSSSSLRRPRSSPGPASNGRTPLRFPARLSWGFSTHSPTCVTRYVGGGKERPTSTAHSLMARLLSMAGDGPPPSRRRAEAAAQDLPVPPRPRGARWQTSALKRRRRLGEGAARRRQREYRRRLCRRFRGRFYDARHCSVCLTFSADAAAKPAAASRGHRCDDSPRPVTAAETSRDCSEGSGSSSERRGRSRNAGGCRKERHNLMERERRWAERGAGGLWGGGVDAVATLTLSWVGRRRIRVYCDELNMLVPLCHAKCDKVTTLQLTTAYLRYIHKMHGDAFREVVGFMPD